LQLLNDVLNELNAKRYRALELIADFIREPSRELRLNAIVCNVSDEDLKWVTDRLHHFLLKLLEDAEYDPAEEEDFLSYEIGLTD
jgi:hypothetical protein